MARPLPRTQFTLALACPRCRADGSAVWEENSRGSPEGLARKLLAIDGPFHSETGRTQSGDPLIVCNGCDQIQPD